MVNSGYSVIPSVNLYTQIYMLIGTFLEGCTNYQKERDF